MYISHLDCISTIKPLGEPFEFFNEDFLYLHPVLIPKIKSNLLSLSIWASECRLIVNTFKSKQALELVQFGCVVTGTFPLLPKLKIDV